MLDSNTYVCGKKRWIRTLYLWVNHLQNNTWQKVLPARASPPGICGHVVLIKSHSYSTRKNKYHALLLIRDVYTGSKFLPSRNPDPVSASKNLSTLTQKIVSKLSEIWSGFFIPDPDPDFLPSRIPDPGVKKAPDPRSGSAPLVSCDTCLGRER